MRQATGLWMAWVGAAMLMAACGDETLPAADASEVLVPPDVTQDTVVPDTFVPLDVVAQDTSRLDSSPADTFVQDTAAIDSLQHDTFVVDALIADTGPSDAFVQDTMVADTMVADTAIQDTFVADTTTADTWTGPQECPAPAALTPLVGSTVLVGETFAGAANAVTFSTAVCSDAPNSAERGYTFTLAAPTEIYLATACAWDCELVLTHGGCEESDVVACETTLGAESIAKEVLEAGTYYVFVEGDEPADPAAFDLQFSVNHRGGQAVCQDVEALNATDPANCEDPFFGAPRYALTLPGEVLTPADGDDFFIDGVGSCTHDQAHAGGAPDRVYSFTLPAGGARDVEISLAPADGWDAMLYLTTAPCGAVASVLDCSDTSLTSGESLSLSLAPGTYYVVVDGFGEEVLGGNAWGAYDLDLLVFDDACDQ